MEYGVPNLDTAPLMTTRPGSDVSAKMPRISSLDLGILNPGRFYFIFILLFFFLVKKRGIEKGK